LGVNADVATLRAIATSLREAGYAADVREADKADPLGGVVDVMRFAPCADVIGSMGLTN